MTRFYHFYGQKPTGVTYVRMCGGRSLQNLTLERLLYARLQDTDGAVMVMSAASGS